MEDRDEMAGPINAEDYSLDFQIQFLDSAYKPVKLDPRIGMFHFGVNTESYDTLSADFTRLETVESTESVIGRYNNKPGVYKPKDFS